MLPPLRLQHEVRPQPACLRAANIALVLSFVLCARAWAIPSPDLVVNLFASAAQVLGLVSVLLGSWFFGRRRSASASTRGNARSWKIAFAVSSSLCVLAALGWVFFALSVRDQRERRLHVNLERSSKEDGKTVGDTSLKELSFSDQLKRPDGIKTEDFEALRAAGRFPQIYDVREGEEYEMGRIADVPHARYPDLMRAPSKYLKKSKPAMLLCFNGNRSSEMCVELREEGYEVFFVIGGYEKWIAEDRPLQMSAHHERTELRELPQYENKDVLLATEDVLDLLSDQDVLFVDVRYPGEFEGLGHLPGAVNVPARKLTTPELEVALRALPMKPVVIPCYDRRSSFYASIIGLKLSRMGYEFLGRYTTPESFSVPGKDKPHVAAWKARQEEDTLLGNIQAPLVTSMKAGLVGLGSLALAIALLVLALRLLVLPLTLKADRDRLVQARLEPRLKEIAASCKGDARAVSAATLKLLREQRVRPMVNLLASTLQILLFTLTFGVVVAVAKDSQERFLWIPALGEHDPLYVLPLLTGLLLAAIIVLGSERVTRTRKLVAGLVGIALVALVWRLAAAPNLYLVLNLGLLALQTWLVGAWMRARTRRAERASAPLPATSVAALRDADRIEGMGNKAIRLARLLRADLPVPDGFVVSCTAVEAWRAAGHWSASDRADIQRAFDALGAQRVAVRSSGLNEDGNAKSYAGVFESLLDVRPEDLFEALEEVARSLDSGRARAYGDGPAERGGIVVQAMVPAEYAGVLFTEHPGSSGACAIELVEGLGEALVSGRADPVSVRLGRRSGRPLDATPAPIELGPLFELGRRVETLFGQPQDIEWAYAGGRFHLLQARDVTRLASQGTSARALRERERARLLALCEGVEADEVVLAQSELSELLPRPTPYSLSWMSTMWNHGGSADRACAQLGIPYQVLPDSAPFVVSAFGSTFINKPEEARRLTRAPGALASFRLSRAAGEIERSWQEVHLPEFLRHARLRDALDLTQLTFKELLELHEETTRRILEESYLEAERVNIAADFYFKAAIRALESKGLDAAQQLAHLPVTVVQQAMDRLAAAGRGETDLGSFVKFFGHRSPQDYELSQPRYSESPKIVRSMAQRAAPQSRRPEGPLPRIDNKVLTMIVERARRFQALKEEAKHHALRDFAFLRRLLLELGERLDVGEQIFQLEQAEIGRLEGAQFRQEVAPALMRERAAASQAFEGLGFSGEIRLFDLERLELDPTRAGALDQPRGEERVLRGLRVSGSGDVVGRARRLTSSEEIDLFRDGEVLVARFTDPTWTPVFPRARGIVTEVGGWLSHAAIQARECDITAIVGVAGALSSIESGDLVVLRADGSVHKLPERRVELRHRVDTAIQVQRETEQLGATLADVSAQGALVLVPGYSLEIGEDIGLECVALEQRLEATVVRNGLPGIYGVRFREPVTDHLQQLLAQRGSAALH